MWGLFDRVGCLVVDDETVERRLATRTTNAFGKNPEDLDRILGWNRDLEASYREVGAVIIEATRPVEAVAAEVLDLASDLGW